MAQTITEALAEIKTIGKRIEAKFAGLQPYVAREDKVRDPLNDQGGSRQYIQREMQAIRDLEDRKILLRLAIQRANQNTSLTVGGETQVVAWWLTWRKEVAQEQAHRLRSVREAILRLRNDQRGKGRTVVGVNQTPTTPEDILVNVDEVELNQKIERIETALGELDGKLSLLNATTFVEA